VLVTEAPGPEEKRVLVVDDEDVMRDLIGSVLDASALPHDEACDGIAALQRLSTTSYGAVILDLMMPVMDGFSVIRSVASRDPEYLRRVIVLSAATSELLGRVDNRVFGVLRKPFGTKELVATVQRCLHGAEPAA
jgi:CheY-like chemotaxis protein